MAALGVKTVINLTSDDADASEPVMAKQTGLSYVGIGLLIVGLLLIAISRSARWAVISSSTSGRSASA